MPYTVVIADDITGANDIGIMYAAAGLSAYVYSYGEGEGQAYGSCDVLIVDTDSRFDTYETAYRKVYNAIKAIPKEGVKQYIDKQCSVFRGNIGAEFDAMLDALKEEFAVVVLGFPDNGRTTIDGIHYVYGIPLAESQFRHDPVHPMKESDLLKILGGQTKRKVGGIGWQVYERGEKAVAAALQKAKKEMNYCIMDVRDNEDLKLLARALKEEKVLCGSSALSKYLAQLKTEGRGEKRKRKSVCRKQRVFCMAGSLTPQTVGQTAYMKAQGYPVITLDTVRLFEKDTYRAECERVLTAVKKAYGDSDFVMIHSMNEPSQVAETKAIAQRYGIGNTDVSAMVSRALSEIAAEAAEALKLRRIIVCGGDTSASLCARLGIRGMKVLHEIEAGLPTCESLEEPYYRMVLKSGSFGSREFIEKAKEKLWLEEEEDGNTGACETADGTIS